MKSAILLLIAVCLGSLALPAQTTYSPEVEAQIKQVENSLAGEIQIQGQPKYNLQARMAHYKVKGLSLAVVHDYKIVWAKGYGWADEKEQRPVTVETMFEPGSISKTFNALGILKLVQDKKLDLDTDINTYLKSWTFPYDSLSDGKKITLAQLLSHTAGLTVHGFGGYNRMGAIPTLPEILDGKAPANSPPVRSAFAPGLKQQYSGGGTTISQLILNDLTQQPYDQWMQANVLQPLGMTHSSFTQPPAPENLNNVATGYRGDGSEVDDKFHAYPEQGAAGLWTTPTDLCKYIIETQLALQGKSQKVLNKKMTQLRLKPYENPEAALGVFIENRDGTKYFQHGAGNEGFRGFYYGSLEGGNGVAVVVNSDNGGIMFEVMNSVADVYGWKGFYKPTIKQEVPVSDAVSRGYEGIYLFEGQFAHILNRADGSYFFSDGTYSKMHFSSETDFFNLEFQADKHFTTDAAGNVTGYARSFKGKSLPAAIKVQNPDTLQAVAGVLNFIGWNLMENKKFDEARRYLQRGLVLYPDDRFILGNLAHCLLFQGDADAALKIYQAHLGESLDNQYTWNSMILQDFQFFQKQGFAIDPMKNILMELNLELPEGFDGR